MLTRGLDSSQSLLHAIEIATDGEVTALDDAALKSIKALCKTSSNNCCAAADLLIARFQDDNPQVAPLNIFSLKNC
jgi:hypothetical protein